MKSKSFDFYNITSTDKSLAVRPGLSIMHIESILTPSQCNFLTLFFFFFTFLFPSRYDVGPKDVLSRLQWLFCLHAAINLIGSGPLWLHPLTLLVSPCPLVTQKLLPIFPPTHSLSGKSHLDLADYLAPQVLRDLLFQILLCPSSACTLHPVGEDWILSAKWRPPGPRGRQRALSSRILELPALLEQSVTDIIRRNAAGYHGSVSRETGEGECAGEGGSGLYQSEGVQGGRERKGGRSAESLRSLSTRSSGSTESYCSGTEPGYQQYFE